MIQIIIIAIVAVWLTWGIANVVWGFGKILWGVVRAIAAVGLFALAYVLEFVGYIARRLS